MKLDLFLFKTLEFRLFRKQFDERKMSEGGQGSSFSIGDYLDNADEIRIANQINGNQMEELFKDLVEKAKQYRQKSEIFEARAEALKNKVVDQWRVNGELRDKMDKMTRKLKLAEATAKNYEEKYMRLHSKLKDLVLETAAEANNGEQTD